MTRKCAICGLESEIEDALLPVRDSYGSDKRFYCSACSEKRSTHLGESYLIACALVLIGGLLWVIINPKNELAWLMFQGGLFMCFWVVLTVPHELGHVLAGFAARAKTSKVTIGLGRTLYKHDFLGIEWKFCALPICGFTSVAIGDRKFYRVRSFLTTLGGPLTNFLLGAAALFVLFRLSSPWLSAVTKSFIAANILALLYGLLPRKVNIGGRSMSSDGLLLLTEPFMSRSEIDKEIEGYYVWEGYTYSMKGRIEDARRSYEKGLAHFPDSVELQSRMGRVLLELGNYAEAKNMFVQLRKNTDLEPAMAIHLLNEIATANVMIGGNDLLEEADAFSKTACEKMPWQTEFKGTRGVVLARKGHVEQGLALLKEAMDKTENPSHKAVYASYIAEFENKKRE